MGKRREIRAKEISARGREVRDAAVGLAEHGGDAVKDFVSSSGSAAKEFASSTAAAAKDLLDATEKAVDRLNRGTVEPRRKSHKLFKTTLVLGVGAFLAINEKARNAIGKRFRGQEPAPWDGARPSNGELRSDQPATTFNP